MIMPSFATLLSNSSRKIRGNDGPLLWTKLLDESFDLGVLLGCPWTLDQIWIENFLPSMKTLHVGPFGKTLANFFPVLGVVLLDEAAQELVFLLRPACFLTPLAVLVLLRFVLGRGRRVGGVGGGGGGGEGEGGGGGQGGKPDRPDAVSLWCQWTAGLDASIRGGLAKQTSSNDVIRHWCLGGV